MRCELKRPRTALRGGSPTDCNRWAYKTRRQDYFDTSHLIPDTQYLIPDTRYLSPDNRQVILVRALTFVPGLNGPTAIITCCSPDFSKACADL